MNDKNTIFLIPMRYEDFNAFTAAAASSALWEHTPREQVMPRYLLNYASNIAANSNLFQSFSLKDPGSLDVYMFGEEVPLETPPCLKEVRLSCFSTGIGFLGFHVSYDPAVTVEQVANFSYYFKKAAKITPREPMAGKYSLYTVAGRILPQDAHLFFTAATPFKYECLCYHYMHLDENYDREKNDARMVLLKRSYHTNFLEQFANDCDMRYAPYTYDHWGGSSEGFANITYNANNEFTDYFLNNLKKSHQEVDYYFMYLLLLLQRFTAIKHITEIAEENDAPAYRLDKLNRQIITLKTVFTFNIISNDRVYQDVYSKMYQVLDIEQLLKDVLDNEGQMEVVQNMRSVKNDKLSNKFLFGLSVLSLFSALIDASSYFDRFDSVRPASTILSLVCTSLIVLSCLAWILRSQGDKKDKSRKKQK